MILSITLYQKKKRLCLLQTFLASRPASFFKRFYPGLTTLLTSRSLILFRTLNIHRALSRIHMMQFNLTSPPLYVQRDGVIRNTLVDHPEKFNNSNISFIADTKYLPLNYTVKNIVSGLMTLSEKEREVLMANSDLGQSFREILFKIYYKVIYNFTKNKYNTLQECLEEGLKHVFGFSENLIDLNNPISKEINTKIYKMIGDKVLPLTQHFIVSFWNNRKFPFKILQNYCNKLGIDCTSFEGESNITILSFIEAFYIGELVKVINNNYLTYYLVNANKTSSLPVYFNLVDAKEQTNQKYPDALVTEQINNSSRYYIKYYIDVKTFPTSGVDRCRFSMFHLTDKSRLRFINDFRISLKNIINKNAYPKDHPISIMFERIKNTKDVNISERYTKVLTLILNAMFNKNYKPLNISLILDAGKDIDFDVILDKGTTLTPEEVLVLLERIKIMFPNSPIITQDIPALVKDTISYFPKEDHKSIEYVLETIIFKSIE